MKPVNQTKFGYPEGNCLMACVASILEVDLDALPDLFEECCTPLDDGEGVTWDDGNWWDVLQQSVRAHGWEAVYRGDHPEQHPGGYAIAGGPGGRAFDEQGEDVGHCVVYVDGEMVHDPHPDKTGLSGPIEDWILLDKGAHIA